MIGNQLHGKDHNGVRCEAQRLVILSVDRRRNRFLEMIEQLLERGSLRDPPKAGHSAT